jgi:NAD(P)-dependent dehydrogenase (short-subunit alcohol dehydrogenase family)
MDGETSEASETAARSGRTRPVAWITGASSGIGKAVAQRLAANGYDVAVSARSEDKLEAIAAATPNIIAVPLDITDADAIEDAIETIERRLGPIDLAMFCAATWKVLDVEELDAEAIQRGMSVNFNGTVGTLVPIAKRMMARRKGRIAIVASVAGYRGLPRSSAYGPTKAALINLAECLQPDLARHNVDVTIINPGFVDTPMTADNDFPMPFLMKVDEAASSIVAGLSRGKYEIAFPWQLVGILKFFQMLPNTWFLWLMRRYVAKSPKERKSDKAD